MASKFSLVVAICICIGFFCQQTILAQPTTPTLTVGDAQTGAEEFAQRLDSLKEKSTLSDDEALSDLVSKVEGAFASAREAEGRRVKSEQDRKETPALLEQYRAELAKPTTKVEVERPDGSTLSDAEQSLSVARAASEEANKRVTDLEAEKARRTTRRTEIPQQIVDAQSKLRELRTGTSATPNPSDSNEMAEGKELLRDVQMLELLEQIAAWEAELKNYEARSQLLSMRRDAAAQAAVTATEELKQWTQIVEDARQEEADRIVEEAEAAASAATPELANLAKRNAELAGLRSGEDGLTQRMSNLNDLNVKLTKKQAEVARKYQEAQEKVQSIGLNSAIGIFLRNELASLPRISDYRKRLDKRENEIPEIQLQLMNLQEERRTLSDQFDAQVRSAMADLEGDLDPSKSADLESEVRSLLRTRLEILQSLILNYEQYFNLLVDTDVIERQVIMQTSEYREFIQEWVLWIRGPSAFSLSTLKQFGQATVWLITDADWLGVAGAIYTDAIIYPVPYGISILLFVVLLVLHRRIAHLLRHTADSLGKKQEFFWPTALATLYTVLLAIPIPLAVLMMGMRLDNMLSAPDLAGWVASGLLDLVPLLAILEMARQTCRSGGLAEKHFGWEPAGLKVVRRTLIWLTPVLALIGLTSWIIALQPNTQWQITFGSVLMVILMSIVVSVFYRLLSPDGELMKGILSHRSEGHAKWVTRFWRPLLVGIPMLLIFAVIAGYTYAAFPLAECYLQSILLAIGIVFTRGFVLRWLMVMRRRLATEKARKRLEQIRSKMSGEDRESMAPEPVENEINLSQIDEQTRRLFRWAIVMVSVGGLWLIWIDVLPALGILKQVELWHETGSTIQEVAATGDSSGSEQSVSVTRVVTLSDLLLALLIFGVTAVAARNLPGLLEISILQRLKLDAGLRFAFTTMSRYLLVMLGIVLGFGAISIGWSKVQWLAAAFTVGLGFGLQEIFANFVSGIIILFERPVRIGDMVTVGNVTGRIDRIQMRATVITDFDRRELLVPNKEFVTGQIVNWSLTDKVSRLLVPVGVAYGSDTDLALKILLEVAQQNPKTLDDPAPSAVFWEFGASSLDLRLYVFLPNRDAFLETKTEILSEIDKRFKEAGLEIAFPQQDIHVRSIDIPMEIVHKSPKAIDDVSKSVAAQEAADVHTVEKEEEDDEEDV